MFLRDWGEGKREGANEGREGQREREKRSIRKDGGGKEGEGEDLGSTCLSLGGFLSKRKGKIWKPGAQRADPFSVGNQVTSP